MEIKLTKEVDKGDNVVIHTTTKDDITATLSSILNSTDFNNKIAVCRVELLSEDPESCIDYIKSGIPEMVIIDCKGTICINGVLTEIYNQGLFEDWEIKILEDDIEYVSISGNNILLRDKFNIDILELKRHSNGRFEIIINQF